MQRVQYVSAQTPVDPLAPTVRGVAQPVERVAQRSSRRVAAAEPRQDQHVVAVAVGRGGDQGRDAHHERRQLWTRLQLSPQVDRAPTWVAHGVVASGAKAVRAARSCSA